MVRHHPAKFGGYKHGGSGDVFDLSCDLASSRDSRAIRLFREESLNLSQHPVKFGVVRHCGGGDFVERSPSW